MWSPLLNSEMNVGEDIIRNFHTLNSEMNVGGKSFQLSEINVGENVKIFER